VIDSLAAHRRGGGVAPTEGSGASSLMSRLSSAAGDLRGGIFAIRLLPTTWLSCVTATEETFVCVSY
jgi:hypothetical protein